MRLGKDTGRDGNGCGRVEKCAERNGAMAHWDIAQTSFPHCFNCTVEGRVRGALEAVSL